MILCSIELNSKGKNISQKVKYLCLLNENMVGLVPYNEASGNR